MLMDYTTYDRIYNTLALSVPEHISQDKGIDYFPKAAFAQRTMYAMRLASNYTIINVDSFLPHSC